MRGHEKQNGREKRREGEKKGREASGEAINVKSLGPLFCYSCENLSALTVEGELLQHHTPVFPPMSWFCSPLCNAHTAEIHNAGFCIVAITSESAWCSCSIHMDSALAISFKRSYSQVLYGAA